MSRGDPFHAQLSPLLSHQVEKFIGTTIMDVPSFSVPTFDYSSLVQTLGYILWNWSQLTSNLFYRLNFSNFSLPALP